MTIKNLYPPNRPASIYNVINGRPELPVGSTFSRASEATYVDQSGLIRVAAAGEPRFDYDPTTGEYRGLLLEKDSTNPMTKNTTITSVITDYPVVSSGTTKQTTGLIPDSTFNFYQLKTENNAWGLATVKAFTFTPTLSKSYAVFSFYAKKDETYPMQYVGFRVYSNKENKYLSFSMFDMDTGLATPGTGDYNYSIDCGNGWRRYVVRLSQYLPAGSVSCYLENSTGPGAGGGTGGYPVITEGRTYFYGLQVDNTLTLNTGVPSSLIINETTSDKKREADAFSLIGVNNFDNGFSLLLDSETTTTDFVYKIKASGSEIASLNNDNGTLDWNVNGNSAKLSEDYPQVGFTPGRVRTISSFTAAGDAVNPNYLYTKGLSFPTIGAPGFGADELELGVPQTLKAVYVWANQLEPIQAVSIIKGDTNIIPNIPVVATNYTFVYNTDPTNSGAVDVDLPYIIPTAVSGGMTIDWGDGSPVRPYNKGVVPAHTYPYPGQYRIQISGNETWNPAGNISGTLTGGGFDSARLGSSDNKRTITKLEAWPPQFRETASGAGFTGQQLKEILYYQSIPDIPKFRYSGLTDLSFAFASCSYTNSDGWDWVPVNLPDADNMAGAFSYLSQFPEDGVTSERDSFPQLQTSSKLQNVSACFVGTPISGFKISGSKTLFPWSNTTNVTNWSSALSNTDITEIGNLDTSNAQYVNGLFDGCGQLPSIPQLNFNKVINATSLMSNCLALESFPAINMPECLTVQSAWQNCKNVNFKSFPQINLAKCANFSNAWNGCIRLETFPSAMDFSEATSISGAWLDCNSLTSFTGYSFPKVKNATNAWRNNVSMGSGMGAVQLPVCENIENAWFNSQLTAFPAGVDVGEVTTASNVWRLNSLTSFPSTLMPKCTKFIQCWQDNTGLADFPANMFDAPRVYVAEGFEDTWKNCALTAASIENILLSILEGSKDNSQPAVKVGMQDGTNADYSTWTTPAKNAHQALVTAGFVFTINDSTNAAPTSLQGDGYYITQSDSGVAFGEIKPEQSVVSIHSTEIIEDETEAVAKVLELDNEYFPKWDRETLYTVGDRVMFGSRVYRSLDNDTPSVVKKDEDEPTPMNRPQRWEEIYEPEPEELYEEKSYRRSVQRPAQPCD